MTEDPFNIRAHVAHWEASVADYRLASEATRKAHPDRRTMAYGPLPDQTLDIFVPRGSGAGRPIHLFIHGGYWRSFAKEDFAFMAEAITGAGAVAAIVDYPLMPQARMARLVADVRAAARWLAANAEAIGGDPGRITASGHSAGAHLASYLVARGPDEPGLALAPVAAVLLVSGIYDLAPIARSFLQPDLRLTEAEIAGFSPLGATFDPRAAVRILVGEEETPPFHTQAAALHDRVSAQPAGSRLTTVAGTDHMTIVRELGRPGSPVAAHLEAVIAGT